MCRYTSCVWERLAVIEMVNYNWGFLNEKEKLGKGVSQELAAAPGGQTGRVPACARQPTAWRRDLPQRRPLG